MQGARHGDANVVHKSYPQLSYVVLGGIDRVVIPGTAQTKLRSALLAEAVVGTVSVLASRAQHGATPQAEITLEVFA